MQELKTTVTVKNISKATQLVAVEYGKPKEKIAKGKEFETTPQNAKNLVRMYPKSFRVISTNVNDSAEITNLEKRVAELEAENEALQERIEELEAEEGDKEPGDGEDGDDDANPGDDADKLAKIQETDKKKPTKNKTGVLVFI